MQVRNHIPKLHTFSRYLIYIVIFAFNMPDKTASGLQNEVRLRICTLLHFHSLQVVGFAAIEDVDLSVLVHLLCTWSAVGLIYIIKSIGYALEIGGKGLVSSRNYFPNPQGLFPNLRKRCLNHPMLCLIIRNLRLILWWIQPLCYLLTGVLLLLLPLVFL